MTRRVTVRWTTTAKEALARLPQKVRRGLLAKADQLRGADDPKDAGKALTGPLQGYYRITYGRYRAVYTVEEEQLSGGEVVLHIIVTFVAAGIRREHDQHDVYDLAKRLIKFGLDQTIDEVAKRRRERPDAGPQT